MWNHHDMHFPVVEENIRLLSLATSPLFRGLDVSINAYVPYKNGGQKNSTVRINFQINLPLNLRYGTTYA